MSSISSISSKSTNTICFISDIEGNLDYFNHYLSISEGVYMNKENELALKDGYEFIFGGDVGDKGIGTLRCINLLVQFKKTYPDRVTLLLGNRDINKMRLTSELDENALKDMDTGAYWVPECDRISPREYYIKELSNQLNLLPNQITEEQINAFNTRTNRLKWMLQETMGSKGDFERRRQELIHLSTNQKNTNDITDDQVVQSYLDSVLHNGRMREYLQLGVLGCIKQETLYVHGGIIGYYNGIELKSCFDSILSNSRTIHKWIEQLNQWCQNQINEWIQYPTFQTKNSRGGDDLMKYVCPSNQPSIILSRHLNSNWMPLYVPKEIVSKCKDSCISRIVVGHTPYGHSPTLIKQKDLHVIMTDTSYSDSSFPDNRGYAVSELLIDKNNLGRIYGQIDQNNWIQYTTDDPYIGKELNNGYWIKAKLKNELNQYIIFQTNESKIFQYQTITEKEIQEIGINTKWL